MYVTGCAALGAEGFVLVGSAAQSAILRALMSVNGSWSPSPPPPSPWDDAWPAWQAVESEGGKSK